MQDLLWSSGIGTMLVLAGGTLVTEDLTSIAAGVLVANGRIDFARATLACFAGIYFGDLVLFLLGRRFGRRLLTRPLVGRFIPAPAIERSAAWLDERGRWAVILTRLLPGTRLPTYIAAGALGASPWKFAAWFAVAAAVWTPLLVWLSSAFGAQVAQAAVRTGSGIAAGLAATATLWLLLLGVRAAMSWRVRRLAFGAWRRWTRWEFWPPWIVYPPVVAYIVCLMVRYRSVTVFTAVNPGIVGGGVVGESKFQILRALAGSGRVARAAFLPGDLPAGDRQRVARLFMRAAAVTFPIVLKPDQGQRGSGVVIARDAKSLAEHLERSPVDLILQEHVPGLEFGIFYCRRPGEARGRIFSITEKRFPHVLGDGRRSLEDLVLQDSRAVCCVPTLRRAHAARWDEVPARGERVDLVEIGSHCRGAVFLDGARLATPWLEAAVDAAAQCFEGFCFGRFDVRAPSIEALQRGEFRILELNGVTSEATHIYDPSNTVWDAYRVLFEQWRLAFEFGADHRRRGVIPLSLRSLAVLLWRYRRTSRLHPVHAPAPPVPRNPEWRETSNPA